MIPVYLLRSKLTSSRYFPVSAFIDLHVIFHVDLYSAAVRLVVENDLLTKENTEIYHPHPTAKHSLTYG